MPKNDELGRGLSEGIYQNEGRKDADDGPQPHKDGNDLHVNLYASNTVDGIHSEVGARLSTAVTTPNSPCRYR